MIECGGLLNAEKVEIWFGSGGHVGSIGGGEIEIARSGGEIVNHSISIFSRFSNNGDIRNFTVDEYIEGDTVEIENVTVPVVTGRIVTVGKGCEIDTVRYSEQCEISPDAKVGKTEKI